MEKVSSAFKKNHLFASLSHIHVHHVTHPETAF